tara:strand:+ start:239 stop:442 length:204 start_codon:yes stop_codon:yes gene_type:complete
MPDIRKYSSISMTKKAYNNLKQVQEHYSEELGIEFSLAKLVEHLAANKVKDFYHKDSQCIRENKEIN